MRPQRSQHILRLQRRSPLVGLCAVWVVAIFVDNRSTHAQHSTFGDQVSYYGTLPANFNYQMPADFDSGDGDSLDYAPSADFGGRVGSDTLVGVDMEPSGFFRLTDDIGEDGLVGGILVGNPVTGAVIVLTDFSDIHTTNMNFGPFPLEQRSGMQSFDLGAVHWIYEDESEPSDSDRRAALRTMKVLQNYRDRSNAGQHKLANPVLVSSTPRSQVGPQFTRFAANQRGGRFGIVYGYREFDIWDRYRLNNDIGILGHIDLRTATENFVTGPQVGVVAFKNFGPLSFYLHGLLVAGINDGAVDQATTTGEPLVPGAVNRLLYTQMTTTSYGEESDEFVPAGMLWAETGLQITRNTSLKLAWSALFVDNVLFTEGRTRLFLPDMGLIDPGNQHLFLQNFYCGIEMVR